MATELEKNVSAPDGRYEAALKWAGEVRFGPAYYRLYLDGRELRDRFFGDHLVWSRDSRYLLVQEWGSMSETAGPQTALVAFDFQQGRECVLATATGGFVEPVDLVDGLVRYRKSYYSEGRTIDYDQDLPPPDRWLTSRGLT